MNTTTYNDYDIAYRYTLNSFGEFIIYILIAFTLLCTYKFNYLYNNQYLIWMAFIAIAVTSLGYLYGLTPVEIPNLVKFEASFDVDKKLMARMLLSERQVMM